MNTGGNKSRKNTNANQQRQKSKRYKGQNVIELKDNCAQTIVETKTSIYQTLFSDLSNGEKVKLLESEKCSLQNKYDALQDEINLLKKTNEELLAKLELTSTSEDELNSLKSENSSLQSNYDALKDETEVLRISNKDLLTKLEASSNDEEFTLLKLENCSMKNKCCNLEEENVSLQKSKAELTAKLEVISKQMKFAEEILEINRKLNDDVIQLREKLSGDVSDKEKETESQIIELREKLVDYNKILQDNENLKISIIKLEIDLQKADYSIDSLKKVLAMCQDNESDTEVLEPSEVSQQKLPSFKANPPADSGNKKGSSKLMNNSSYEGRSRYQWKPKSPSSKKNPKWDQGPYSQRPPRNWNRNGSNYQQSRTFHNKHYQN